MCTHYVNTYVFFFSFKNRKDVQGIFHFSGLERYTKYQMALAIVTLFQLPMDHIERDQQSGANTNVQRPDNAQLDSSKLSEQLGIHITRANFEATIKKCLEPFI